MQARTVVPPVARRLRAFLSALVLLGALAGCYTYVILPGEVKHENVSAPFVLHIVNRSGNVFAVEPSRFGEDNGFAAQSVAPDASFDVLLQVRKFRIGDRDRVGGHQVLDGPYVAQDGPNTAVIRVRHSELYPLTIDLESDRWFAAQTSSSPAAIQLPVVLENFAPKRWFPSGPP